MKSYHHCAVFNVTENKEETEISPVYEQDIIPLKHCPLKFSQLTSESLESRVKEKMTIPKPMYIIFTKYDKTVTFIGLHIIITNLSETVNAGGTVIKITSKSVQNSCPNK